MGVFAQILINRPRRGHRAGTPVTGVVRYIVDEPGRYKDIILSLIGKGKCEWSERHGKTTVYYSGKEVFTEQHLSIHQKGPEDAFILPIGTYERPFTFVLPNNIPSSFKNKTCTIAYKLVLKFERPGFFSIHKKFHTEIKVIGDVHPIKPDGITVTELDKTLFTPFKKRKNLINLQAETPNSVFRPGEGVVVNYKVTNNTDIIIPTVKAELVCKNTYIANCGNKKKSTKTISECTVEMPSVPDNAIANLASTIQIPDHLYTIQNTRIMTIEYRIKVTLRLPMPYINASTKIPIVIGERQGAYYEEFNVPNPEDGVAEPPSYFEVMDESKEDKEKL